MKLPPSPTLLLPLVLMSILTGCDSRTASGPRGQSDIQATTGSSPLTRVSFEDVADRTGIHFIPRNGEEKGYLSILESLGTGVGVLDYDQDGWADLVFSGGGTYSDVPETIGFPPALYRQLGELNFVATTESAGLNFVPFYSHGIGVGDFNSDGFPDVLISGYHGLLLYQNSGDGTFVDVTQGSGLITNQWSTSTAWADANGDGILDLYVVHYVDWSFAKHPNCILHGHRDICGPKEFNALNDELYFGNGDGTFWAAGSEVGLVEGGRGLGVVAADLDLDGDVDFYIANDTNPNFLYRNDGQGRFREVGLLSGTALGEDGQAEGSMGVDVGDYNGDGLPDIWVANYENQSFALYRNEGDCHFQHVSGITGVTAVGAQYVGFGTTFLDFNLDGNEDIFATNGHVMHHPANAPVLQKPLLFENIERKRFVNIAETAGTYMQSTHIGRGVAAVDLDHDGDPDMIVSHTNAPVAILLNESLGKGGWFRIRLIGTTAHRDAVGARVTVTAGGRTMTKWVKGGSSFLSAQPYELLFGLADATLIDSVEITWPGGQAQTVSNVRGGTFITIRQPFEISPGGVELQKTRK